VAISESREVSQSLVTDPRVAFFSFIGSPGVGSHLRSLLSPGTRCALEHGGAAPVILAPDADLDVAVASILKGGYDHAGQVCVSVQRVYAPRNLAKGFAQRLADGASKLIVGDATNEKAEVGPLIRPSEVERIHQRVGEAGVERLTGGQPIGETLYQPTVLLDPAEDANVSQREIVGPVVCIYDYAEIADAIKHANSLPFAVQAAVFTRDIDTAMRVFRQLDASASYLVLSSRNASCR
jgi:acyl-CoA reductase-like NAD-dependent aldehyde dehydrogenase